MKIAIIGDRGIPARYSGFSTLVEELAVRLVRDHGMDVTVYCRRHYYDQRPPSYRSIRCVYLPAPGGKSFESLIHSSASILHASVEPFDLAFIVDPGNAPLSLALRGISMGTAYAVWAGIGAVGVAVTGMILFGESREALRLLSIVAIIAGIVGLKLTAT